MRRITFFMLLGVSLFFFYKKRHHLSHIIPFTTSVVESKHITTVLSHVKQETLVVFDLDATLIEPTQMLGNDPWAYYAGDKVIEECGGNVQEGLKKFEPLWYAVQKRVNVKLVEKAALGVLATLQQRGIKTLGFTSRGRGLIDRTYEQLASVGLDLSKNSIWDHEEKGDTFYFNQGILFTDVGGNKGKIFHSFLEKIGKKPKHIVFVDDKEKYVNHMQKMCHQEAIPFVGIWYRGAKKTIKNFNPAIADVQLAHFLASNGEVLSDQAAELILQKNEKIALRKAEYSYVPNH